MKPTHKKKKTKSKPKYASTLSQPVEQKKKIISKIKHHPINNPITQIQFTTNKPKLKKPNTLHEKNNLLYQTIKVLRERKCICNCHRNKDNNCNCEHNNNNDKSLNQFRNNNKEYHNNYNSNVFSEGTTLVSTHSTIFNKNIPNRDKIKYADKMRRSYSINSQNVNDNIECINNNNFTNFNNGSLSHTLRHSNSMNHIINLNCVNRNNMRDNYTNNNNTNEIINVNEQQRNNYNNNNNLYNSEQSDIVNQLYQEDELSPPVLNNNTKRILKRSASYNENINNEMSLNTPTRNKEFNNESRNTFSFNPNDKDNNNMMNNNNNNSVHQPPPFINEYPKDNNNNNNISQSYSYRYPQQRSPSPINKLNISGSISPIKTSITPIHTRNIKYKSNSTSRATSQKAKHVNIMKDKIDMKAFEKDFRNINLNSFKTKLQTFLKNNNNINKITSDSFYNSKNKENFNSMNYNKGNNLLNNLLSNLPSHGYGYLDMKSNCSLSKLYNKKPYNNINLKKFLGMNNKNNNHNTNLNLFSKYIDKSSVMPANEYVSVIKAREFLFMNE